MFLRKSSSSNDKLEDNKTDATEGGILAKLWRVILKETKKKEIILMLINSYYKRESERDSSLPSVHKVKSRSQISSNVYASSMTFKVFIDLLKNILCVKHVRLNIELTWADDSVSDHSVEFRMSTITPEQDNDVLDEFKNKGKEKKKDE